MITAGYEVGSRKTPGQMPNSSDYCVKNWNIYCLEELLRSALNYNKTAIRNLKKNKLIDLKYLEFYLMYACVHEPPNANLFRYDS